ncbi:MAG TPA: alcohol dehydrogenase catalytic domain-containing protein [Acidimicrobiales bacterium]|nr:alcohol dehydrogenase catalytic domain-containing protein [Acidimicrobiales bacterium]
MPPELMPAAVYVGDGRITVQNLPVPVPGPDEVLIEVAQCGICGSDMHLVLEGYARAGTVLGHEWAGTVVAAGAAVSGWEAGARVVSNPTAGCGTCRPCRRGRPSVCLSREAPDYLSFGGAFCRYLAVRAEQLLRLPDTLSTRAAALTEPTAIAVHTVNLSQVTSDDRVLVTGAGPVGLLAVAVLLARGVTDITVSEPSAARRARAAALGAAAVIAPDQFPVPQLGRPVDAPFAVAFECSGHASAAEAALDQLDFAGTLVLVGTGRDLPRINHNRMIVLELTIVGAYNYDADGFRPALDLLASGLLPTDLLIEPDDVPLSGVGEAMQRLAHGEIAGKVLVRPQATS